MKLYYLPVLTILLFSCKTEEQQSEASNDIEKTKNTETANSTDMKRVTGVGGIFFKVEDPEETRNWYKDHLGLKTNEYGSLFEFREGANPDQKGYLQWSPFSESTKYFEPSAKEYMINFRVQNIEKLVELLKEEGVQVLDEIEEYEYGKFVHILDPNGLKLELWEPVDSVFTEMNEGNTTM